jgi:hypothetical protein
VDVFKAVKPLFAESDVEGSKARGDGAGSREAAADFAGAFFVKQGNKRRFNRLRATTSMIAAKIALTAIQKGYVTEKEARRAIAATVREVEYPEKQQTNWIWKYQADFVVVLCQKLKLNKKQVSDAGLSRLHDAMRPLHEAELAAA